MKKKITLAYTAALSLALIISGCSKTPSADGDGSRSYKKNVTVKTVEQTDSKAADKFSGTAGDQNDTQTDSAKPAASGLTLIKEMPQLQPDSHPFSIGPFYLIRNTDGTVSFINADGEVMQSESLQSVTVLMPFKPGETRFDLLADLTDGSIGMYRIDGNSLTYSPGVGGLGGAALPNFYDPGTDRVLKMDPQGAVVDRDLQEFRQSLGFSSENLILLVYPLLNETDIATGAYYSLNERYAVCLNNDSVYGPVMFDEIVPWNEAADGINIYDLSEVYETIFPATIDGQLSLVGAGQVLGQYDVIKVTGNGSAFVQNSKGSWLAQMDGSLIELPAGATYCSGLNVSRILVLENNVWKLYQVN